MHDHSTAAPDASTERDPVCGMTVRPDSPHRATYQGRTFHFCSAGCLAKFTADPERYLAPKPATPPTSVHAAEWTCPMHPEIVRDRPGSCPICGMALEPRTVSLTDRENPELTDMRRRLRVCTALTAPLLLIMIATLLPGQPIHRLVPIGAMGWIAMLFATPAGLWGGWPFFVRVPDSLV